MRDLSVRSIDAPRERPVPLEFDGLDAEGRPAHVVLRGMTLVVAVKADCDACAEVLEAGVDDFGGFEGLVVAREVRALSGEGTVDRLASNALFDAVDLRFPPCYALIDAGRAMVVAEGALYSLAHAVTEARRQITR